MRIPGKCKCGELLNHRVLEEKEGKKTLYFITGICDKCKTAYLMNVFKKKPDPEKINIHWEEEVRCLKSYINGDLPLDE